MRKLVAHLFQPQPAVNWYEALAALGYRLADASRWQLDDFALDLQFDGDLWCHGEGNSLPAAQFQALLEIAQRLAGGGELELFEEDGRLLQRHHF